METPYVDDTERLVLEEIGNQFYRIRLRYGFMQEPDVPSALGMMERTGNNFHLKEGTFFLGSEHLLATSRPGMAIWRERLFAFMARNARRAPTYFHLPPGAVVEVGAPIEL
jgi:KUP system potassium uptake protein